MNGRKTRILAAGVLTLGSLTLAAPSAQAETWAARCSGAEADLCVMAALQNSEQALIAAVSERRTELRQTRGAESLALESAQIQWMAATQNGCAARANDAASGEFDRVFGSCLAESYDARRVELEAALN